jgi:hypothetical protein
MSKQKRNIRSEKKADNSFISKFNFNDILPQKHHIWAVILVLVILFLIFLNPLYFGGKSFQSGDIISSHSMEPYVQKDREGFSLWNPYIFTGMPAYAIGTEATWFNLIYMGYSLIRKIFAAPFPVDYAKWTFFLIVMGITTFLLIRHLTKNSLASLFGAVSTSFSTGLIVFLFIGHVTKLTSLCMYPLLFLLLLRLKDRIKIIDFLLLIITLQLLIQGFHLQIIFYTLLAAAIYYIYFFIRAIVKKEILVRNNLLKSAGITIAAAAIAFLIQADNFSQIYEYTPYSTRGTKGILEQETGTNAQSASEFYDYHTNWSFSPGEVMTFIVPSYFGFGTSTYKGPLTNNQEVEVNTYFGQMPFVDVAMYMGVLVFFLALFAIFTMWKEPYVQFLTILSGIALLISFGKTFPFLFDFLFYNLPYFDKFRVPSMILVLVQMSFPVLASFGIVRIIQAKADNDSKILKAVKYIFYAAGGVFILSLLLSSPIKDWFTARVNEYAVLKPQSARELNALAGYAADMFTTDLLFAFGFTTLAFGGALLFLRNKFSADFFILSLVLLSLIDLWRIDARGAKYIDNPDDSEMFAEPGYINVIKSQNDKEPFRILNLKQDRSLGSFNNNSNFNAYFLVEDFYGYSGIKPRAYQDILDVVGPVNATLWRMLNVKYVITDQQVDFPGLSQISTTDKSVVYRYDGALPRVYFVDSVRQLSGLQILNEIKASSFDPSRIAFVDENIGNIDPAASSTANITTYLEDHVVVDVNASGNNFLFFGTIYLPTGWKAFIDGNETKIYKANHGYMGIVVPAGSHKVEFKYAPDSFYISKYLSLILSSLVIGGLFLVILLKKY